jgi:hypothetical protein
MPPARMEVARVDDPIWQEPLVPEVAPMASLAPGGVGSFCARDGLVSGNHHSAESS